jgi:protein-tyrosine-phosphatase/DNA-binding transcriptional ArsR family regulator
MSTEQTAALRARAARHAALSDPARLMIIDTLSLGDASPTELQALLGMPSNLLAHHLRVLEGEGMIARSRSEADRRRTYLQLLPAALDGLLPAAHAAAARVVFVCTANSARSQLASALWRRASAVPTASAGTHPAQRIDPGALAAARRNGLPMRNLRPRSVEAVLQPGDFVITVCDSAHEQAAGLPGLHWSVPDPVRAGTAVAFDAVIQALTRRVADLAPRLIAS